jgi:hypothetical protein
MLTYFVFALNPHSFFTDNGSPENNVDDETERWPVPDHLHGDLDDIKRTYQATPLHVFSRDTFVEVGNVNDIIRGALIEMHFELYHYNIRGKDQDSFNAQIQQIIVLQPGKLRPITAYKQKNVRDGPIRVCPAPLNVNAIATGSSASGSGTEQQKSVSALSPKPHLTTRTALDTSPSATNEGGEIGNTTPATNNEGGKTRKTVSHFQGKPLLNRLLVAEQNSVSKGKGKARDISK